MSRWLGLAVFVAVVGACDDGGSADGGLDVGAADASDAGPGDAGAPDAMDAGAADADPIDAAGLDADPIDATLDATPADADPIDATPADAASDASLADAELDASLADAEPEDADPIDAAPDATPADADPIDATPDAGLADAAPTDAAAPDAGGGCHGEGFGADAASIRTVASLPAMTGGTIALGAYDLTDVQTTGALSGSIRASWRFLAGGVLHAIDQTALSGSPPPPLVRTFAWSTAASTLTREVRCGGADDFANGFTAAGDTLQIRQGSLMLVFTRRP